MKICPKCQAKMEAGFAAVRVRPGRRVVSAWLEGEPRNRLWGGVKLGKREAAQIATYRCTGCGFLEDYAER